MTVSSREKKLAVLLLLAVLFGVTGMLARGRIDKWRDANEALRTARAELAQQRSLVEGRDAWQERYEGMRELMPVFEPDRQLDTYWMGIMDRAAARHGVSILKRQAGSERQVGDVYELPIECREWEGSLDAVINFLYELQSEGVMLDVRQMLLKPQKQDDVSVLRGRFTLYCAYMRAPAEIPTGAGKAEGEPVAAPVRPAAEPVTGPPAVEDTPNEETATDSPKE